jgi:hypothetical protein
MAMLGLTACNPLPEVAYETDRLEIAPEFSHPVCAGTLASLDAHVSEVERQLGLPYRRDPVRIYWMRDSVRDFCREGVRGCFFPGTRVVFGRGPSLNHELVHAALDSGGEAFFMEEGVAEVLSGVGVYFDTDGYGPGEGLRLSRSSYRTGSLDYAAAAHFVHWVRKTAGVPAMLRLSEEIKADVDGARMVSALEDMLGESIRDIEARYVTDAPAFYPGLYERRMSQLEVEQLEEGIARTLDCSEDDTYGPRWDDGPGMFRVEHVHLPHAGRFALHMSSSKPGAWVTLFDPRAKVRKGVVTDWMIPDPDVDTAALRLSPGEFREVELAAGTYLLMFGSDAPDEPVTINLHLYP